MLTQIILYHGFDVCISIEKFNRYAIKIIKFHILVDSFS